MRSLTLKLTSTVASLMLFSGVAFGSLGQAAASGSTGQITSAYKIANLTKSSGYANPQTADACNEVQYKMSLWNPGPGALSNLKVEVALPATTGTSNTSTVDMTANNADPASSSAMTTLNLSSAQTVTYEAGTAQLLDSNGNIVESLPDSLVNGFQGGVNVGGLNESQLEFITFKAKTGCPTPPAPVYTCDALGLTVENSRSVKISSFSTTAKNGATFKNADIAWGDNTTSTGLNPVIGKTHQYTKDGNYTIAATAHFSVNGQDVTAGGPSCMQTIKISTPPKAPVYTCDIFDITAGDNRTITITKFSETAKNGAKFNNVVVDWGDNLAQLTSASPIGHTHQYAADGTYNVTATAHFSVNGKDVTAGGSQCSKKVTFTTGQPPVVTPVPPTPATPAAPTSLVNTGPGSVAGLFATATAAGTVAYRRLLGRRLSRES